MRRRCDRPQAKRGATQDKPSDHLPPRLQVRPDKAKASCLTARWALPARQPQLGRTWLKTSHHHRRAEQRGQTKRQQLLACATYDTRPPTSAPTKLNAKPKPQRAATRQSGDRQT